MKGLRGCCGMALGGGSAGKWKGLSARRVLPIYSSLTTEVLISTQSLFGTAL